MISKKCNRKGATGPMQRVSQEDIDKYHENNDPDFVNPMPKSVRSEKFRLGKFFRTYFGQHESSCGNCGAVYRFAPRCDDDGVDRFAEIKEFFDKTKTEKCPCCEMSLGETIKRFPERIFGLFETEILGKKVLKLKAESPLSYEEKFYRWIEKTKE